MAQTVPLTREQAAIGHTALMDWSSFFKLTDKASVDILRQRLTFPVDPITFRESLGSHLVDLIARLVVYDGLLLDTAAKQPFNNPLSPEAVRIAQVQFEPAIYEAAIDTTLRYLRTIEAGRVTQTGVLEVDNFFCSDIKRYAAEISRGFHIVPGIIADSNQSVPRTIFYLEMSRQLGLPLFLSYQKRDLLERLEKRLWQDAFSLVSKAVDEAVIRSQAIRPGEHDVTLQTPAVVDLVIRRAFSRKISLEQSIIEVRNLEGAQQFRELLANLQPLVMVGDRASWLSINKLMAPLLKAARTWAIAADPQVHWMWQAKVSKLPKIAEFLEVLGIDVPAIPIKFPFRSYVQFVSEWYNNRSSDSFELETVS